MQKLLAQTHQPTARAEPAVEPTEAQAPLAAAPVEVRSAAAAAAAPNSPRKDEVGASPALGDLVLVLKQPLGVLLAEIGVELAGSLFELGARDEALGAEEELNSLEVANLRDGGVEADVGLEGPTSLFGHVPLEGGDWDVAFQNKLESAHRVIEGNCPFIHSPRNLIEASLELAVLVVADTLARHDNLLSLFSHQLRPIRNCNATALSRQCLVLSLSKY